ncbi:NADH dehydrogenase [Nymphon striatum]|nr:NADH dehydrogenase [Nymphon striatum]
MQKPRIVVVGGGAGGLNLVTRLSRSLGRKGKADITLVDENLSHIWKPSLHEFAAGTKGPEEEISFLEHSNRNGYKFRLGRFAGIDCEERLVTLDPVLGDEDVELYTTPTEAKRLQSEILNLCLRMETGALETDKGAIRLAIVGGGATGVELAAELREATEQLGRNGIDKLRIPDSVGITVVEGSNRLVAALPEKVSEKVLSELKFLDIEVLLQTRVSEVSEKKLECSNGDVLEAEIIVWAAGIRSNNALASATDLEVGSLGRLLVGPTLQTTHYDEIFVMGDAADCYWSEMSCSLPPRAQVASQQAAFLEGQLRRRVRGEALKEFKYTDHGSLVALSSSSAIGSLMGRALGTMTLKGWLARRAYKYLHYQHEAAVQGHFRALVRTLLSMAMRELKINGLNLVKDRKAALSEVGILFQNPDHQIIFPTVEEEISFGLRQQGLSKRDAADLTAATLSDFGKSHWATANISTLSQGQKHLVCMMAIVAMQPRLIILDEPFTGLDMPTKAQLTRYLSRYHGGLVHISHDPIDLQGYEQIIWLDQGRLTEIGDALPILENYIARMKNLGGLDDISELSPTIILRMLSAVGMANLVTMTTRLSDMIEVVKWIASPLRRIGLNSRILELAIALVIRLTPVLVERGNQLTQAWKARSNRAPGWRIILPFTVLAIDDADRVAEALRARGGFNNIKEI